MIPTRSLNEQWLYVGLPGTGKSWAAREDAWAACRAQGGYLIAHDPTESFLDLGVKVPSARYATPEALAKGVAERGGAVAHVIDTDDGDLVLSVALRLAAASMAQAPANRGRFRPVYVYWDEAVAAGDGMRARMLSPLWMDAIARRRRYGIAPVMTSQSTYFAHRTVLTFASRIKVFRLADPADAIRLRSVGVTKELAAKVSSLPDRQFIEIRNGQVFRG